MSFKNNQMLPMRIDFKFSFSKYLLISKINPHLLPDATANTSEKPGNAPIPSSCAKILFNHPESTLHISEAGK